MTTAATNLEVNVTSGPTDAKCVDCGTRKANRTCGRRGGKRVCSRCCGEHRGWQACPVDCRYFPAEPGPNLALHRIEAATSTGDRLLAVEHLYIPNLYAYVFCNVTDVRVEFLDLQTARIVCGFLLRRTFATNPNQLLSKEEWKTHYFPDGCVDLGLMPLVGIAMRGQGLPDVETMRLTPDGESRVAGNLWMLVPPHQRPLFGPANAGSSFATDAVQLLGVRNTMVFAPLLFDQPYTLDMTITDITSLSPSGHLGSRVGLVLPFGRVQMSPPVVSPPPKNRFVGAALESLVPVAAQTYPGESFHDDGRAVSAMPVFCRQVRDQIQGELIPRGDISRDPNLVAVLSDGPCASLLTLALEPAEGVQASVLQHSHVVNATLLPTLRHWLGPMGCPLQLVLVNSTDASADVVVKETNQTSGMSRIETMTLGPRELRHEPLELPGLSADVSGAVSLAIEVESAGSLVMQKAVSLRLLKADHLVLRIEDEIRDWYRDTIDAIACWVTPDAASIDAWVSEARVFCSDGMGDGAGVPIDRQLSALWSALQQRGVTYVDRSYSIDTGGATSYQRVCTPSETLSLKSGNCIDLAVLFASALEQLGFRPAILTTVGHAFLGWLDDSGAVQGCLETTLIAAADCPSAIAVGSQEFGSLEDFTRDGNGRVIDVLLARTEGLLPLFD